MPEILNQQPEQQRPADDMAENFIDNAFKLIYDEKTLPLILEHLQSNAPAEGVVAATMIIVQRLMEIAVEAGKPFEQETILFGIKDIVQDLAELSAAKGIHEFTDEELVQVLQMAIDKAVELTLFATVEQSPPQAPVAPAPAQRGLLAGR